MGPFFPSRLFWSSSWTCIVVDGPVWNDLVVVYYYSQGHLKQVEILSKGQHFYVTFKIFPVLPLLYLSFFIVVLYFNVFIFSNLIKFFFFLNDKNIPARSFVMQEHKGRSLDHNMATHILSFAPPPPKDAKGCSP